MEDLLNCMKREEHAVLPLDRSNASGSDLIIDGGGRDRQMENQLSNCRLNLDTTNFKQKDCMTNQRCGVVRGICKH